MKRQRKQQPRRTKRDVKYFWRMWDGWWTSPGFGGNERRLREYWQTVKWAQFDNNSDVPWLATRYY